MQGFSALFHSCTSMAVAWSLRFLALDLLGISCLILGSFIAGVYQVSVLLFVLPIASPPSPAF